MLSLASVLALPIVCSAQISQQPTDILEPLTKLEAFEYQTGIVLVKNYADIGSVSGFGGTVSVTGYQFVEPVSGRKEYGIVVEITSGENPPRLERIYVDYDELDALVAGVDYIIKIDKVAALENFEAQYKTRGELTVTTFSRSTGALRASISSGLIGRSRVRMSLGNLADFRKLIIDAKSTLDKIR